MTNKEMQLPLYLIDSNIILDILLNFNNATTEWSIATLIHCADHGNIAINPIIYAEVAYTFSELKELEKALADYHKLPLPWEAAFIASKAFAAYKKNGGKRHTIMADFYIGAHALFAKLTLVTRDNGYQHYFPGLKLISP